MSYFGLCTVHFSYLSFFSLSLPNVRFMIIYISRQSVFFVSNFVLDFLQKYTSTSKRLGLSSI